MKIEKITHIIKDIAEYTGGRESGRVYTITDCGDGKTDAVIELKVSMRCKIQDINAVMAMYRVMDSYSFDFEEVSGLKLKTFKDRENNEEL